MGSDGVEFTEVEAEHVAVEEEDRAQRLVLRAGGNAVVDGQVGEERLDIGGAEGGGVLEAVGGAVEADEALDPPGVAVLGAAA